MGLLHKVRACTVWIHVEKNGDPDDVRINAVRFHPGKKEEGQLGEVGLESCMPGSCKGVFRLGG